MNENSYYDSRPYRCSHCERIEVDTDVPPGWYSVRRFRPDNDRRRIIGCGLFCSARCMGKRMPRIEAIETAQAERARREEVAA